MMINVVHIVLFTFLGVIAIAIIRMKDLFAAVMLAGIFSLLSASLFTVMDAVDVAFTEAAVGAGVSTILMLATISLTRRQEVPEHNRTRPIGLLVVLLTGAALVYATFDMPRYGDPKAPIHHHVAPRYIQDTEEEIGVPNMVTAVLASYRGYDTWGETTVIFTACVGVLLLLGGSETVRRRLKNKDSTQEEEEGGGG
jgi:multicomponent Na+:H+ antiporter subunit B